MLLGTPGNDTEKPITSEAFRRRMVNAWSYLQPKHFPIAYKLALIITLVIAVGMTLLGIVIADGQSRLLRQQMNQFGHVLIGQLSETVQEPLLANDAITLRLVAAGITSHVGVLGAALYSDEVKPVVQEGRVPPATQTAQLLAQIEAGRTVAVIDWEAAEGRPESAVTVYFAPVILRDLTVGYALLTFDHTQLLRAQRDTLRAVSAATLLMVVLGGFAAVVLGKRLSRPINALMDASLQVARGDYTFRFTGRRNDEIGTLMEAFNDMSDGLLRKEQVEQVFSRYVSPKVAKEVLSDLDQVQLGGEHVDASVMFADIVGFTALSESMTPQQINALLNEYYGMIADAAHAYHGHVDKYMGDCAMLVFGVPQPEEHHSLHALCCAVLVRQLINELNRRRTAAGRVPVHFHIGCNSGVMLAGNMGSNERMEYTVVGDAVNLASRLATAAGPDQIIISKAMHDLPGIAEQIVSREYDLIKLRGKQTPVAIFEVIDIAEHYREEMAQHYERILLQRPEGEPT